MSDATIFRLVLIVVWAVAALLMAAPLRTRVRAGSLIGMAALCAVVPFALAKDDPTSGYDELGSIVVAALLLAALAIGSVWGYAARKIVKTVTRWYGRQAQDRAALIFVLGLAITPPIGSALYTIERQTVPDAPCSHDSITFSLGDRSFRLPAKVGGGVELQRGSTKQPLGLLYSLDRNRREHLAQLCRLSDGGRRTIPVEAIRLGAHRFDPVAEELCKETDQGDQNPPGCAAILRGTVKQIWLSSAPHELSAFLTWFDGPSRPNTITGGDADNGYVCHKTEGSGLYTRCNVWMVNAPGIYVLARSHPFYEGTDADLLADVRDAVAFTFAVFEETDK